MTEDAVEADARGYPIVRGLRAAFVFMTRIPVGGFPYSPDDWAWAPAHFPLVGVVVGAAAAAVLSLTSALGTLVSATLAVATASWITGAMHEDGLADTADALGGSHDRERILEILKDSRIGTFGALGLGVTVLLRVGVLAELSARGAAALVLAHTLARAVPVWLVLSVPYVSTTESKSLALVKGDRRSQAVVATGWAGLACGVCAWLGSSAAEIAVAVVAVMAVAMLSGLWFKHRVGGVTGDLLGAAEQTAETVVLVAVLGTARAGIG